MLVEPASNPVLGGLHPVSPVSKLFQHSRSGGGMDRAELEGRYARLRVELERASKSAGGSAYIDRLTRELAAMERVARPPLSPERTGRESSTPGDTDVLLQKAIYVGDTVQLASGLSFKVTLAADPTRPWYAVESAEHWRVRRKRLEGGVTTFYGGR